MKIRQLDGIIYPAELYEILFTLKPHAAIKDSEWKCFGEYPIGTMVQIMPPVQEGILLLHVPNENMRYVEVSPDEEIEDLFFADETPKEFIPTISGVPILGTLAGNSIAV